MTSVTNLKKFEEIKNQAEFKKVVKVLSRTVGSYNREPDEYDFLFDMETAEIAIYMLKHE